MNDEPTTMTAILTLAKLTFVRLQRGKLLWIALAIACLPVLAATGMAQQEKHDLARTLAVGAHLMPKVFGIEMLVLAILPPLFVASSIGDEIEDRTTTYLWSRPLARWTILAGKLLALAPFAIVVIVASWIVAIQMSLHVMPSLESIGGLAAGALAVSLISAGIATVIPKQGMALSIIYILIFDLGVGQIPAAIQMISVTHAAQTIAGYDNTTSPLSAAIAMAIVAGVWIMVGFRRIHELEA